MDDKHIDDKLNNDDSRTIGSGNRETARMDQDNEKNIATPKAGANREAEMRIEQGADDIDERKRSELAGDELAKLHGNGDPGGVDIEPGADNRKPDQKNP